jgi:DNA-binding IclR family transcriptional regulator
VLRAFAADADAAITPEEKMLYERIRQQGYYAASGDRLADVAGISAPVFRGDGSLSAAVTLTMPANRYTDAHIPAVLHAAQQLSGRVG